MSGFVWLAIAGLVCLVVGLWLYAVRLEGERDRLLCAVKQWRDAPKRVTSTEDYEEQKDARDNLIAVLEQVEGEQS